MALRSYQTEPPLVDRRTKRVVSGGAALRGSTLLQRQIGNRAAAPLIQREPDDDYDDYDDKDRGAGDDDRQQLLKAEHEVDEEYRAMGLVLIEGYRQMDQVSAALTARKNPQAAKRLTLSLVTIGLSIGAKFIGLPDIPIEGAAEVAADGMASADVASKAASASGMAEKGVAKGDTSSDSGRYHTTTRKGIVKAAIKAKVGSKKAVAKTVVGVIIPLTSMETAADALVDLLKSEADWNKSKSSIIDAVIHTMNALDDICRKIEVAGMEDLAVKAVKRKLKFATSLRTLGDIVKKYRSKRDKLLDVIAQWDNEHGETRHLLSMEYNADGDDDKSR